MRVEASISIDRSLADVWEFYAVNHIANHPRWDSTIKLQATSEEPIRVGTVIQRRVTRFGNVTEGTMKVTQFEPESVMRVLIQDGPMAIQGFATFQAAGDDRTEMTIGGEIPGIDEALADQIRTMMGTSVANIKALIESEA